MSEKLKLYHNPRCRKSREALNLLTENSVKFDTVLYLKQPPSKETVAWIFDTYSGSSDDLIRKNEAVWKENFKGKTMPKEALIEAGNRTPHSFGASAFNYPKKCDFRKDRWKIFQSIYNTNWMKNRVKNNFLIGVALLSIQFIFSQSVTLSGKVVDQQTNIPLEYCTVSVLDSNTDQLVEGSITKTDGTFAIELAKGTYTVLIDYISFESKKITPVKINNDLDLGTVLLEIDTQQLENVTIVREKTEVEIRLDKRVYNVGKDLTIRGGTVSDVLDNVPSVSVDIEGNVALRGNQNVRILINGKPSSLVGLSRRRCLEAIACRNHRQSRGNYFSFSTIRGRRIGRNY
jgi:arsenate reductase-like glutaredoxin family protein